MAVAGGSFASHVIARAEFVQKRPAGQTAEEGAAFPIAFLTADFCLNHLAKMRSGDRVLVHAATGGVGMAAVRLAQRAGADVFATAGSEWKRDLLRAMGVQHVLDSRTANFSDEILAITRGRGVDVVLNSLSGDLIDASFRALGNGGRFIEIGKRGIKTPAEVGALGRDYQYAIVDWGETGEKDPALIGGMFAQLVDELARGAIAPLPRHTFALEDAGRAFRFMAQARHAGKIVVRHTANESVPVRGDGTYLVTGGLSGLGPVIARWLAERGAGRLVLIGRRGVTAESAPVLDEIRGAGVEVIAEAVDATDGDALRALLSRVRSSGSPIRGVLLSAGVLDDAALLQQTAETVSSVMAPKVAGAYHLDRLTRSDPLDWFVLFSSVAAVLGSRGQANHSAANAFLDSLATVRSSRGLPGLSVNWGAWSNVGAAASRGMADRLAAQGLSPITPRQGIQALERVMAGREPQVAVLPANWRRFLDRSGANLHEHLLADLVGSEPVSAVTAGKSSSQTDIRASLESAPASRRPAIVSAFVRERALRALGLDPSRAVDPRAPLGEMGLDSLLAVELRNTLGKAVGRTLPATLLFDYPTIETLTAYFLNDVFALAPAGESAAKVPVPAPARGVVDAIEDLSDEEVERQLAARAAKKAR
jgi:NADPH:quinone reductase-like Zn-dependent oxidoreductase